MGHPRASPCACANSGPQACRFGTPDGAKGDIRAADACRPLSGGSRLSRPSSTTRCRPPSGRQLSFFADRVYLALPTKAASRLDRDEIAETGIGVIAVGDRGARIVIGARLRTPERPGIRCWCEEIELGELVGERRRVIAPFTARFATPRPEQLVPDPWSQQGVLDLRDAWRS